MSKRRTFSQEFKQGAVEQARQSEGELRKATLNLPRAHVMCFDPGTSREGMLPAEFCGLNYVPLCK